MKLSSIVRGLLATLLLLLGVELGLPVLFPGSLTGHIVVALAGLGLLLALGVGLQRRLHRPLADLCALADRHLVGDHTGRASSLREPAPPELHLLGRALDHLAQRLEDEQARHDVTESELRRARNQAEQASRAKTSFLANMGHEIRTPMNAIIGMTHLARQTSMNEHQRQYLDKVHGASQQLLGVINDVLDFSRIESGNVVLENVPLRIEPVVAQALALVREKAQAKQIELLCSYAAPALLAERGSFRGDPLRLSQVLTNLLSNAVKFTRAGQVSLVVDAEPGPSDGKLGLVFHVTDTGIGMTAEQQAGLFREFAQADESPTRRFGGSGLGLAIAKRLVAAMGGQIEVHSQPGAGSRFTLRVPLMADPASGDAAPPEVASAARILVVEDQHDTRLAVLAQLRMLGIGERGRLAGAASAAEAVRALAQAGLQGEPFDMALLDWVLPDVEGGAAMERLWAARPGLRIAVMSAYGDDELREQVRAAGASDFLDKPVLPDDLRRLFGGLQGLAPFVDISLAGLRVLVAEVNPVDQDLVVAMLVSHGARVQLVHNGLQAVERLAADGPQACDVVLMDLQMPVLDGLEASRLLRAQPRFEGLPIIGLSVLGRAEDEALSRAVGMQACLAKPLDWQALKRVLQTHVRRTPARHTPATSAADDALPNSLAGLPSVPGLDLQLAMAHVDHNPVLLERALRGVVQAYGDGIAEWREWLTAGQWDELVRAAHTLQGLTGMVGAMPLRELGAQLQRQAQRHQASAADLTLGVVETQLDALVQALAPLLERPDAGSPVSQSGELTMAPEDALAGLQALLEQSDAQATEWWRTHRRAIGQALSPGALRLTGAAIHAYDFDAALEALAPQRVLPTF